MPGVSTTDICLDKKGLLAEDLMLQHANCEGLSPVSLCNCHLLQQALGPCDSDLDFHLGQGILFLFYYFILF